MRDGREARFLFLPDGEDPDSLIRRIGYDQFFKQTVDCVPLSQFFYETLCQQVDIRSVDGRGHLVELVRPMLQKLPDSVFRDLMLDQLGKLSGLPAAQLSSRMFGNSPPVSTQAPKRRPVAAGRSPVRVAIRLLLEQPELSACVEDPTAFSDLELPGIELLIELLEMLQRHPHLNTASILEHWRGRPEERHLAQLAATPLEIPGDGLQQELRGAIQRLTEQRAAQRMQQLLSMDHGSGLTDTEKQELKQLLAARHPMQGQTR